MLEKSYLEKLIVCRDPVLLTGESGRLFVGRKIEVIINFPKNVTRTQFSHFDSTVRKHFGRTCYFNSRSGIFVITFKSFDLELKKSDLEKRVTYSLCKFLERCLAM